jgi:hypothetical protein
MAESHAHDAPTVASPAECLHLLTVSGVNRHLGQCDCGHPVRVANLLSDQCCATVAMHREHLRYVASLRARAVPPVGD